MRIRSTLLAALTAGALALSAAPAGAATAGSPNDDLVRKWYADFLGRDAREGFDASGGRGYWVDRLDAKEDPRRILESILSSAEFAEDTTERYYRDYLGRPADDVGSNYWKSGIRGDMEPEWVEQNVLASSEYAQKNTNPVAGWYRAILGRDANLGEVSFWRSRVDAVGALNAVRELWYSQEAVERRIRLAYDDLLGRRGNQVAGGELDYWYDRAARGRLNFYVDLALTPEYGPEGSATRPAPQPPTPAPNSPATDPRAVTTTPAVPAGTAPANGTVFTAPAWKAEVSFAACTQGEASRDGSRDYRASVNLKNTETDPELSHGYRVEIAWVTAKGEVITTQSFTRDGSIGGGGELVPQEVRRVEVSRRVNGAGDVAGCVARRVTVRD